MRNYNNQTDAQKAKSHERWANAIKIDKFFKEGKTRQEIAKKLNMRLNYVRTAISDNWIDDVPEGFTGGE